MEHVCHDLHSLPLDGASWFVQRQALGMAGANALERLIGSPLSDWAPGGVAPFPLLRVAQGSTLILEGAPARSLYLVQAGDFKTVQTAEDGYEQVLDFAGPSDLLGFDGVANGRYVCGAVALEDASVYAIPVADLEALRHRMARFDAHLQAMLSRQIGHLGEAAWLMAAVGADRRTARFLLHQSRRMAERGQSANRLRLRMGRRDIASHLGLAHESISRSMKILAEAGFLRVNNREIDILDHDGLEHFARATRGPCDEAEPHARTARATLTRKPFAGLNGCA